MEKKRKLYVSGQMTGLSRKEYLEIFDATAEAFEDEYDVVNPARFIWSRWGWLNRLLGYNVVLCLDLLKLMRCDAMYSIAGWECSKGARIERAVGEVMGLKVM